LVNVPVGLFSATDDKAIHFNQFQAGTSDRVRQKRVNERTGEEVEYADVVKGYDLGGGEFVIVTPEELESVEPGRSRTIEITDFVDLDAIDPIYYKSTYYLGPQGEQAVRPYALLREAMAESNKVAVASLVLRTKEHLVTIRPTQSVLALETMYFADEIRDPAKEIPQATAEISFSDRELGTAKLLIESMEGSWDPSRYHDTHRQKVEELIEEKRQGKTIAASATAPSSKVVDLMEALSASIKAQSAGAKKATTRTSKAPAKRAPAKASAQKATKAPAAKSPRRKAS
jgi:DNA end-binding protein Ku